jgi:glucosamine--fructose-6-phosphate aminotransferase (isomerizing)
MIASMYVLSVIMGLVHKTIDVAEARRRITLLQQLPQHLEEVLTKDDEIKKVALKYKDYDNFYFLGRGTAWPLAMEGALKLKEISYIHAEGYDAAEMKHGPIALIEEKLPSVVVALDDWRYEKVLGNIQELKARSGYVVAIASIGDDKILELVDDAIFVRSESGMLNSIIVALPMQLFAYYIAAERGCDVDKPKNLAKSVTVE